MNEEIADYLCQSLNVQDYFLGETDPTMRLLLEKHLNECDECVAELIGLQRLRALLRLAFSDPSDCFESSRPRNRPRTMVALKIPVDVARKLVSAAWDVGRHRAVVRGGLAQNQAPASPSICKIKVSSGPQKSVSQICWLLLVLAPW